MEKFFNIGGDVPYSINQRYELEHDHASHDKARDILGFKSEWSLDEGIEKMATWAKDAGPRKSKSFSNMEINNKLPGIWKEESDA